MSIQLAQLGISNSRAKRANPIVGSMTVENVTPNLITVYINNGSNLIDQVPDNLQWTISGAVNNPIVTSTLVDTTGKIIQLFLSANILDTDTVLVSYVDPADGTGVKDVGNNYMATFSNFAVTNNTGALPIFSGNANLIWLLTSTGITGSTVEDRSGLNNDGTLVKSHCATVTTATVLTCTTSLSGITVTSNAGTATALIVGNTITFTGGGTAYNMLLSNGSIIPFAGGAGTQVATDNATTALVFNVTAGSIDWTATQDTYHYNFKQGFSHLGRMSAINQYVTLTSNITLSTTKFSLKVIYAPDNIATTQDLLGTATTNTQFAIGSSAGAITGTLRLASGTTYALTCASNAATVGYANNTFATFIWSRDALGTVTATINGFTLLIDGAASVVDAGSSTVSQFMRTSTSNSNIGILKEVEILDHATDSFVGLKYNAENSFRGTLQGGFVLVKYARPQGGDSVHRNLSGNWHNGSETKIKPNPAGDSTLQTATGWTNATELAYADLDTVADPIFCNITNPIRKRNLVSWTTALAYEDEIVANNFVGKTTINITKPTGWSTANHLDLTAGSSYAAALNMTIKLVLIPSGSLYTTSQFIFGKTAAIDGNDWGFGSTANAAGSDFYFWVRNGSNAVVKSRNITFIEKDTNICVISAGIRDNGVGGYEIWIAKDGVVENTLISITGLTTSTSNLVIGSFSGGNAFVGGIIAAAYGTQGLTDNEVEASYQQTKNNVYVEESWMTLLFGSESGNANWVDRIGGSVTLTKTGTITTATVNQAFNNRWKPENWPSTTIPSVLSALTTPTVRGDGDSRTVSATAGVTTNGLYIGVRVLTLADANISGTTYIGSQGSAPVNHYGLNGKDSSTFISEAPGILSVNGSYPANIIVNFIGTNGMTSNTLLDREITEWETLMFSYKRDIPTARFVVVGETEHDDANRRARSNYLMYRKMILIARLREKGYDIIFVNPWRALKMMDGDFIDVVHPNDQGNGKLDDLIYQGIVLSTSHTP